MGVGEAPSLESLQLKEGNGAVVLIHQHGTELTPLEIAQRASSVVYRLPSSEMTLRDSLFAGT